MLTPMINLKAILDQHPFTWMLQSFSRYFHLILTLSMRNHAHQVHPPCPCLPHHRYRPRPVTVEQLSQERSDQHHVGLGHLVPKPAEETVHGVIDVGDRDTLQRCSPRSSWRFCGRKVRKSKCPTTRFTDRKSLGFRVTVPSFSPSVAIGFGVSVLSKMNRHGSRVKQCYNTLPSKLESSMESCMNLH